LSADPERVRIFLKRSWRPNCNYKPGPFLGGSTRKNSSQTWRKNKSVGGNAQSFALRRWTSTHPTNTGTAVATMQINTRSRRGGAHTCEWIRWQRYT